KFVGQKGYRRDLNVAAVIPAMGLFRNKEKLSLKMLGDKPLIAYTIEQASRCGLLNRVIVSTEDCEVAEAAMQYGAEVPFLRPRELSRPRVPVEDVLKNIIDKFKERKDPVPEFIVVLNYYVPFKEERHITEAVNTILLYNTDSVISVVTDLTFHWKPGEQGLTPVGYQKRLLREDKETVYRENGALYVVKTKIIEAGGYLGNKVGHIEMSARASWRVEDDFSFWIAENILAADISLEAQTAGRCLADIEGTKTEQERKLCPKG
ncbi:MAG: acylneuraminate cytidylyltransferase family protein, partial [Candidatus Omnitrophota bacterium]